jgi:Transposase DDE domain group 1
MQTQCEQLTLGFQDHFSRKVLADFNGGEVTSDAGALLLREADLASSLTERFCACFEDHRDQSRIEHSLLSMVRQRLYGLCLGYEDIHDHEQLRHDSLFAILSGKENIEAPLAGKSTLNRLEVSAEKKTRKERYHKFDFSTRTFHGLCRQMFIEAHDESPSEIILDLDATDSPLHGKQEDSFFHGYYDHYCYLPLYIFSGEHLLHAELRPSNIDGAKGSIEALAPIVDTVKKHWPQTRIIIRGDSGYCRDWLMEWCENKGVSYILGLAQNKRLKKRCSRKMEKARRQHLMTKEPARVYTTFGYRTKKSWTAKRRVIAKCEHLSKGANPRFVVTNLLSCEMGSQELYENGYCPRGDMENRIKEQLDLFGDRMSSHHLASNQLRLAFSSMAYILFTRLRKALAGTELAKAYPQTIRLKLLKIGALIKTSTRRILFSLASGYPFKQIFDQCYWTLQKQRPG